MQLRFGTQVLASLRALSGKKVKLLVPQRAALNGKLELVEKECRVACCCVASDYPERCLLCGARGGAATAFPCTSCTVPQAETGNPDFCLHERAGLPLRRDEDESERRERLSLLVQQPRSKTKVEKEATEHSIHIDGVPLGLSGIDLGETRPGLSPIHAAVPPDWLHVVYEGIGKYIVKWTCQLADVSSLCTATKALFAFALQCLEPSVNAFCVADGAFVFAKALCFGCMVLLVCLIAFCCKGGRYTGRARPANGQVSNAPRKCRRPLPPLRQRDFYNPKPPRK